MTDKALLSVVVPAYNEQDSLAQVVNRLVQVVPHLKEILVVDDCSRDETPKIIEQLKEKYPSLVKGFRHEKNRGKTAALKTGFAEATGEIVIVQDADLEYDPTEICDVIGPIVDGVADVVYGSRFMVKKAARVLYFYHYVANKGLTFLSNTMTNLNMSDVETGYKAFRSEITRNMIITSSGFGFEIEVTAKIRYNHPGTSATITPMENNSVRVKLHSPQRAITPGQAAVFYQDDLVVGGGWIAR